MSTETKTKQIYYGYYVAAVLFLLMFPSCLILATAGIFYTPISRELGIPISQFALSSTILQISSAAGTFLLFGKLSAKYTQRSLLTIVMVVEALCFVARATASSIWPFYISAVFLAFPSAMLLNMCIPILMNNWFPYKAGTAVGIVGAAQGLGGVILSSVGGIIIESMGWRACYWVWAVMCLALMPLAWLVIRQQPSDMNLTHWHCPEENGKRASGCEQGCSCL